MVVSCNPQERWNPKLTKKKEVKDVQNKSKFSNLEEVIQRKNSWVKKDGDSLSAALHFNLDTISKVEVEFSPECWISLPFKIENGIILVYWNPVIDSKYDFDIVKAIENIEESNKNKPFIQLELINDSTLKAFYPNPDLRGKLNKAEKDRILFPNLFFARNLL